MQLLQVMKQNKVYSINQSINQSFRMAYTIVSYITKEHISPNICNLPLSQLINKLLFSSTNDTNRDMTKPTK